MSNFQTGRELLIQPYLTSPPAPPPGPLRLVTDLCKPIMYHLKPRRHTQKIAVKVAPTKMLQTKGESIMYRQIIAAEIAFGLLLSTAYRIISKIFYQHVGCRNSNINFVG